ncbi:TPA: hypothetical protein ACH3X1_004629 [Trebouxia sp. C0004]
MSDSSAANVAVKASPEVPACFAPGDQGLLGLRLGGLFGILVVSTIGVFIPFFTYKAKLTSVYFLVRAFAAGVVLTTGYVHVLGDAFPILTDPCLGLSTTYPWAMTIATAASLFTFNLEWILHKTFHQRLMRDAESSVKAVERFDAEAPLPAARADSNDDVAKAADRKVRLKAIQNIVISYTFEAGIIFHSIFIGITLGISSNADTVRSLMIALIFHQGNEGLALGVLFMKAGYNRVKYVLLAAAFIIVTPLGVAIGIGVSNNYNGESKAALGTEGVFDAVSAGILIYNGLCDLILPTFSDDELPQSWTMQVAGFGALYTGAAIMALIGKWA